MASRIARFFFNQEKLAAANAKYKARITEIDENSATVQSAIRDKRADNKREFREAIAANNAAFKEAWSK